MIIYRVEEARGRAYVVASGRRAEGSRRDVYPTFTRSPFRSVVWMRFRSASSPRKFSLNSRNKLNEDAKVALRHTRQNQAPTASLSWSEPKCGALDRDE